MSMIGCPEHRKEDVEKYTSQGWWPGITLGAMLDKTADKYPTKEAIVDDRVRLSYAELRDKVDRLAAGFMKLGITRGDAVLLQLPNWAEFLYSYFALQKVGGVPVLLISGYRQREVSHLCKLTNAKAWIVPDKYRKIDYTSFVEEVRQNNPQLAHIISVRAEAENSCFSSSMEGLMEKELTEDDKQKLIAGSPEATDVSHIVPSGGTTGLPKGIPRTHNDYICNIDYLHKVGEMVPEDVCLLVVPVGHNLALLNVVGAVYVGFKLILLDSTRPVDICKAVSSEKVTYMPMVPSLVRRVLGSEDIKEHDLTSLKRISAGGEPSPPELVKELYDRLGCKYINEFGMTEGLLLRTRLDDDIKVICETVGKICCPYEQVKILGDQGAELPANTDGELVTTGPGIFAGYMSNPEENKKSFTADGFFRTGDLARIEDSGNIKITGRIKDIIIRGGENIGPAQVEDLIRLYPGISDVVVIGIPDKDLGEVACAYIRPASDAKPDLEELVKFMEEEGASKLMIPERFEFIDVIPLTKAGKNDKNALREDIIKRDEQSKG